MSFLFWFLRRLEALKQLIIHVFEAINNSFDNNKQSFEIIHCIHEKLKLCRVFPQLSVEGVTITPFKMNKRR